MKEIKTGLILFMILFAVFLGISTAHSQPAYNARIIEKTTKAWNGQTIVYPPSTGAEVTISEIVIKKGEALPWHIHEILMMVYVLEGQLTLEDVNGNSKVLNQGMTGVESVNTSHRGIATGKTDTRLIGVYLGSEGLKNTKLDTTHIGH